MRRIALIGLMCSIIMRANIAGADGPSFDCSRAAAPAEHLICIDAQLANLDATLATAFRTTRESLDAAGRADKLHEQRQWLQSRLSTCGIPARGDLPADKTAAATVCLTTLYQARIAALQSVPAPAKGPAVAAAAPGTGQAAFVQSILPATGEQATLLTIPAFGRYAVTVKSDQGTALQLTDRMSGPGPVDGSAGHADGRVDAFLDIGQYKISTFADPHGTGDAELAVIPSAELNPDPQQLIELKPIDSELGNYQQRSYWLNIATRRDVAIEVSGRYLDDLRLWKDGKWLVDATPAAAISSAVSGQPLAIRQLALSLEPGLYRLTAYGGAGQKWANGSAAKPLHVRFGIPRLAEAGRSYHMTSATGIDRFVVPATATYFRLDIAQPEKAAISVQQFDPHAVFAGGDNRATIDKTSRDPFAELHSAYQANQQLLLTVEREPGAAYQLTWFDDRTYRQAVAIGNPSSAYLAQFSSGNYQDQLDPTVVVTDPQQHAIASTALKIDHATSWRRRFNLLAETTLFLKATEPVDLVVDGEGATASYIIEPFIANAGSRDASYRDAGYAWKLDPGFYRLTMVPKSAPDQENKGILTISLHPQDTARPEADSPWQAGAMLPLAFTKAGTYLVESNHQANVHTGLRLYNSPIDLGPGITFALAGGQTSALPVTSPGDGQVSAVAEDGTVLPVGVDAAPLAPAASITTGPHQLTVQAPAGGVRAVAVSFVPQALQPDVPLPTIDPALLAGLPVFTALTDGQPAFLDLAPQQKATFAVPVARAALYKLETTGIIQTAGTLRTRVIPALDSESANGIGRNFLIQRYLHEGDYQLTISAPGQSHGPVGASFSQTPLRDEGTLLPDLWARTTLAPGEAGAYRFHIDTAAKYSLHTLGLGHEFAMRLEDSDGWPLLEPGGPADVTINFKPGDYRLILLPGAVENRAVTLLHRIEPEVALSGHGPFAVTLGKPQQNRWLEPEKGAALVPDRWQFTLPAAATITVTIDSGMQGAFTGGDGTERLATAGKPWTGKLPAGTYEIAATSPNHNNRVDYTLEVDSDEVLAGQTRHLTVPTSVFMSVGDTAPLEINSYGDSDVRARLYNSDGQVVATNDDRDNDWNFSIATRLNPGKYRLEIDPVGSASAETDVAVEKGVEVAAPPAVFDQPNTISDPRVQLVPLDGKMIKPDSMLVVAAESVVPVGIAFEVNDGHEWRSLGSTQGANPFIALPMANNQGELRLRIWTRDHSATSIKYAVSNVQLEALSENDFAKGARLKPLPVFDGKIGVARLKSRSGVFFLTDPQDSPFLQWSTGLAATAHNSNGEINGGDAWLVDRLDDKTPPVILRQLRPETGEPITLTLPVSSILGLPVALPVNFPVPAVDQDTAVLWRADGRGDQPIIALGQVGHPLTTALGHDGVVQTSIAIGSPGDTAGWLSLIHQHVSELPITLSRYFYTLPAPSPLVKGTFDGTFADTKAMRFNLPKGPEMLRLNLPVGTAAVLLKNGKPDFVVWSDQTRVIETPTSADQLLLLYTGTDKTPFNISIGDAVLPAAGVQNTPVILYHDAPGTLALSSDLLPEHGSRLTLTGLGTAGTITSISQNTEIAKGRSVKIDSEAHLLIDYAPGMMGYLATSTDKPLPVPGSSITLVTGQPQSVALKPVRIAAGPARLIWAKTAVPVTLFDAPNDVPFEPHLYNNGANFTFFVREGHTRDLMVYPVDPKQEGQLSLSVFDVTPITEGLGPKLRVAPGEGRAFSFTLPEARTVGIGVRALPDTAICSVIRPDGLQSAVGTGKLVMPTLAAGTSYLIVEVPANGPPVEIEPALVGSVLPDNGPPDEVKAQFLALVNKKAQK